MSTTSLSPSPSIDAPKSGRGLHIALWVVQGLLALLFLFSGGMKLVMPVEELAKNMSFIAQSGPALVRFIGASEVAGALGLILPAATRIQPKLTPLAGLGLAVVMVLAVATHVALGELPQTVVPAVVAGLAAFVAWGRWKKAPIAPKA